MANNPLSAALKPGIPVDDAAETRYQSALKQMSEALDQRKNRLFDPTLLAMAQGFLAPTQTGSFFESLGNVAKLTGAQEEKEMKEAQELAALRLQIAQSEREQARKMKGLELLQPPAAVPGVAPAGTPAAPAAGVTGTPAGAPAAPSAAPQITQGNRFGPGVRLPNGVEVTPDLILRMRQFNPEQAEALDKFYKLTMESIAVQPGGYVNKITGEYTPFGGKATVERFVPGNAATGEKAMTLAMSEEDAIAFDKARRTGDAETYYRIIDQYTKRLARPGAAAPSAAAPAAATPAAAGSGQLAVGTVKPGSEVAAKPPSGVAAQTPSEAQAAREVDLEVRKKLALGEAEQKLKATGEVRTAGKAALGLLPVYDRMEQILKTPGIDKVMGVLERGDVQSALGSLVEEAIRVGTFSVGIPAVRKVLAQSGTPQELIDQAATLGQLLAITQFEQRKGLGSGTSVSNFEQQMVNAMGPNMTDTLRSFKQKLSFMREKAKFEAELAKAMRIKGMQYEDFEDTPEFESMFNDYRNRQMNIVYPQAAGSRTRPAAGAPAAAGSAPITSDDLKQRREELKRQATQRNP